VAQGVPHHLRGIGHLWQELGGHERGNFNFAQARSRQGVDPAQLVGCGHGGFDRLQAIARTHFTDQDLRAW
jgi:hypothetical protein